MPRDRKAEQILAEKNARGGAHFSPADGIRATTAVDPYGPGMVNDPSAAHALDEASQGVGTGSPGVGHRRPVW